MEGAVFTVYRNDNGTYVDNGTPYITDSDGEFQIRLRESKDSDPKFAYNTLYKIMETTAPDGYDMPDPVPEYYFYFSNEEDNEHTLPTDIPQNAVDLSKNEHTVFVENVRNTTDIVVKKVWKDSTGATIDHNGNPIMVNVVQQVIGPKDSEENDADDGKSIRYRVDSYWNNDPGIPESLAKGIEVGSTIEFTIKGNFNENYQPPIGIKSGAKIIEGTINWNFATKYYTARAVVTENHVVFGVVLDQYDLTSFAVRPVDDSTSSDNEMVLQENEVDVLELEAGNGWKAYIEGLPLTGEFNGKPVRYTYYVQEIELPNYTVSYDNNTGITSGVITVTNTAKETPTHELPSTGGTGTYWYTAGGALLVMAAGCLLVYRRNGRGKEDGVSS